MIARTGSLGSIMRVTIVTTWFPTHRSPGLGVFVARHAASMAAAGHDIRVVHPPRPPSTTGCATTG